MIVAPGATSISVNVQVVDDSGLPVTGLVAATFPTIYYSLGTNTADTAITPLSDLAAITTSFTAKGIKEREGGYYRVDVPDAAWSAAGRTNIIGEASGKRIICPPIDVQYVQANTVQVGGTSQTARDIGASVLLSSGTGTGQLSLSSGAVIIQSGTGTGQIDVTSGVVKANLVQILATALTETAGLLAAGFKKFFNVSSPTGTVNSLPDAVPGASGGVVVAGSNAATTFATLTVTGAFSINSVSNVAQTGDSFARIGAAGASLTALGDTRIAHLDADVSSRMATYTQPTGFLAATFPSGTIASTTNITAGTIATVSGNVNGNVGGNVTGSVGSISGVTFPTNFSVLSISATTGLVTLAGTQTFNNTGTWTGNLTGSVNSVTTGVTLAAAAVQAIWDALTSALTTTGSIGKSLVTFLGNFANMISGTGTGTPKFTTSALSNAPTGGGGGSGLSGPSSVTLTFVDASTNPVPLVEFTLLSEDKSTAIGSARADSNGVATFGTDDGSYYVTAQATSTVLFADAALTVSGTTTQTITGASNIPTPSTTPGGCNVYDTAIGIDGAAKAGVEYHFRVTQAASGTRNGSEQTATSVGTGTNNIVMALTQGDTVAIKRGTAAQWETFTVPASTSAQLSDLLDEDAAVGKDGSTP